jgi:hypothetical protein
MLYNKEYVALILMSSVSSKLGDLLGLLLMTLFHLAVWETRSYHSKHTTTKSECEAILERVSKTYWLCTGSRVFHNNVLLPTGYIIGRDGYLVWISLSSNGNAFRPEDDVQQSIELHIYGWWSISSLVSAPLQTTSCGEYRIVFQQAFKLYTKYCDNWDAEQFHPNCAKATALILDRLSSRQTGVFFLSGDPGLGKTTTARFLARKLDATLCLDFEELCEARSSPVSEVRNMLQYIQPTRFRPLIIVLDELDEYLFRRNDDDEEEPGEPKDKPLRLRNNAVKKNWGRLLDTIHQSQNILLLCTSNKPKAFFDAFDPALLRPFRITAAMQYDKDRVSDISALSG